MSQLAFRIICALKCCSTKQTGNSYVGCSVLQVQHMCSILYTHCQYVCFCMCSNSAVYVIRKKAALCCGIQIQTWEGKKMIWYKWYLTSGVGINLGLINQFRFAADFGPDHMAKNKPKSGTSSRQGWKYQRYRRCGNFQEEPLDHNNRTVFLLCKFSVI